MTISKKIIKAFSKEIKSKGITPEESKRLAAQLSKAIKDGDVEKVTDFDWG
jgi:hypothetical protein